MYCSSEVKDLLRGCKRGDETFDQVVIRIAERYEPDTAELGEADQ